MCDRIAAAGPSLSPSELAVQNRNKEMVELERKLQAFHMEREEKEAQIGAEFERLKAEMVRQNAESRNRKLAEIKAKVWCRKCPNEAHIHCCVDVHYCSEKCQRRDMRRHQKVHGCPVVPMNRRCSTPAAEMSVAGKFRIAVILKWITG